MSGAAMTAHKQASGVWEEGQKVGESPPIADALRHETIHGSGRKRGKGIRKGRGGGGRAITYPRRRHPIRRRLPTLRMPSPAPVAV